MAIDHEPKLSTREGAEPDGRRRILDATRRRLDNGSEASLRLTDIAAEADVAIGLISHHFGNRDGLVAVAQAEIYEELALRDFITIETAIDTARDRDDLRRRINDLTREVLARGPEAGRLARTAAIGAAHGRPELRETVAEITTRLFDTAAEVIANGQRRGLVRHDLDPRAIATFILSYVFGLVLVELDLSTVSPERLAAVVDLMISVLVDTDGASPDPAMTAGD